MGVRRYKIDEFRELKTRVTDIETNQMCIFIAIAIIIFMNIWIIMLGLQ